MSNYYSPHEGADVDSAVTQVLANLSSAAVIKLYLALGTAALKDSGVANGVATLDSGGRVPIAQLPAALAGALQYQGTWNANTNSPALASGVGTTGFFYKVSVAGTTTIDTVSEWNVGDMLLFNGTIWDKIDNTEEDATTALKGIVKLAQDLAGTADLPVVKKASQDFKLTGLISPSALSSGNLNDWAPTGLSTASVIEVTLNSAALPIITGLTGGADGRIICISHVSGTSIGATLKFSNEDTASSAANRFCFGVTTAAATVTAGFKARFFFQYSGALSRWCFMGATPLQIAGDLAGTQLTPTVKSVNAGFLLLNPSVQGQFTADQNNLAISSSCVVHYVSSDASRNITGISATANAFHILINVGSFDIVFNHENASSTAANRFKFGDSTDFTLVPDGMVIMQYDGNQSRWRMTGTNALNKRGGTVTGALVVSSRLTADKWTNTQSALAYAATTDLDFDGIGVRTLPLTGNVTFTTSNKAAGRMLKIIITADATRTFTWPAWIGDDLLPANITAAMTMVLTLECTGTTDASIIASAKQFTT